MTIKLSHSFSAIKTFKLCPRKYYYLRIAKLVKDQGGEASMHGERIHKMLEERLKGAPELPQEIERYEPLVQSILGSVADGELLVENEWALNDKLAPTGWFDKDAWLRSKLDVLVLKDDFAATFDWKTGKRRPDFEQFEMYAIFIFTFYPNIQSVRCGFLWLQDMAMDTETYHRSALPQLWEKMLLNIREIERALEADVWPAKPSGLCPYCPAKLICEAAQQGRPRR